MGSLNAIPQISTLAALDFWKFMESNDILRECSKCHKIFTTADSRKHFCSGKCFESSRRDYNARSERRRTRKKLLNDIETYGINGFMGESTLYENQGVKPVSKKGRRLIDRAKSCKLSSSELEELFREAAKKARLSS